MSAGADITLGTQTAGAVFVVVGDLEGNAWVGWVVWHRDDRGEGVAKGWPDALLAVDHFLCDRYRTDVAWEVERLLRAEGLNAFFD